MQYRKDKQGRDLSLLGYGCLRFTRSGNQIDTGKAEREVMTALRGGVNYLDTAYVYPGSEAAVGEILRRNGCRDQVVLTTKLPHYLIKSAAGVEKMFQEELRRLQTDHVDFYLMHMLTDTATWDRLLGLGLGRWLEEKRAAGQIRGVGFSYHGSTGPFRRLLDAWDWDICQIQYNYMDERSQAGVEGLRCAHAKGLPVVIMEPLRGGKLVHALPEGAKKLFPAPEAATPAELAFRWLYDQPEVTCVLSGMNSVEMVEENLRVADQGVPGCLGKEGRELVERVRREIERTLKVGCTAFRRENAGASRCVGCGRCEQHCPQGIAIRQELKNAARELETLPYRVVRTAVEVLGLW